MTFAALFALGLIGVSAPGAFRDLLTRLGAPWYVWFLAPIVLLASLARREKEWIPDPNRRRIWSRWIVIGSIALAIGLAKLTREPESSPAPREAGERPRTRGP